MLGCDFVSTVKKLTFDRVLEVAAAFTGGNRLVNLQKLWTGTRHDVRLLVPPVLKRFLELEERTRGTLASRAGDLDAARHTSTLQCAWLMSYWSGGPEITDDLDDFEIAVHPVSIADRRAQQLRRAVIRNHIVFFTIRLLALAKRARGSRADAGAAVPRRNAEAAALCAQPTTPPCVCRRAWGAPCGGAAFNLCDPVDLTAAVVAVFAFDSCANVSTTTSICGGDSVATSARATGSGQVLFTVAGAAGPFATTRASSAAPCRRSSACTILHVVAQMVATIFVKGLAVFLGFVFFVTGGAYWLKYIRGLWTRAQEELKRR